MRRILLVAVLAASVTACLDMRDGDDGTVPELGRGSGSNGLIAGLVVKTPRDHNLEYMVGLASMVVVIVPGLRRKRRDDDATRRA